MYPVQFAVRWGEERILSGVPAARLVVAWPLTISWLPIPTTARHAMAYITRATQPSCSMSSGQSHCGLHIHVAHAFENHTLRVRDGRLLLEGIGAKGSCHTTAWLWVQRGARADKTGRIARSTETGSIVVMHTDSYTELQKREDWPRSEQRDSDG